MSRFHDEFFRQTGPKHDTLMMKALSKAGIEKVFGEKPCYLKAAPAIAKGKVFEHQYNHERYFFWNLQTELNEYVKIEIEKGGMEIPLEIKIKEDFDYETEVICKNGAFIIGYADILITFKSERWLVGQLDGFERSVLDARLSKHVLVEVKPELKDVGAVLRQLKTYETVLSHRCGEISKVVVTYSCPPVDVFEYLEHEGVRIVVFEEGGA